MINYALEKKCSFSSKLKHFWLSKSNLHTVSLKPARMCGVSLFIFTDISLHLHQRNVPAAAASSNSTMSQPRAANNHTDTALSFSSAPARRLQRFCHIPEAKSSVTSFRSSESGYTSFFHPPFLQQPRSDSRLLSRAAPLLCSVVVVEIHRTRSGGRPPNLDADWSAQASATQKRGVGIATVKEGGACRVFYQFIGFLIPPIETPTRHTAHRGVSDFLLRVIKIYFFLHTQSHALIYGLR